MIVDRHAVCRIHGHGTHSPLPQCADGADHRRGNRRPPSPWAWPARIGVRSVPDIRARQTSAARRMPEAASPDLRAGQVELCVQDGSRGRGVRSRRSEGGVTSRSRALRPVALVLEARRSSHRPHPELQRQGAARRRGCPPGQSVPRPQETLRSPRALRFHRRRGEGCR